MTAKHVCLLILWLAILFPASLRAQSDDALPASIEDPIFLQVPQPPYSIESQNGFTLGFGYDYDRCRKYYGDNYYKGCQRRLGLDGKRAESGVTITPPIAGEWRWYGD